MSNLQYKLMLANQEIQQLETNLAAKESQCNALAAQIEVLRQAICKYPTVEIPLVYDALFTQTPAACLSRVMDEKRELVAQVEVLKRGISETFNAVLASTELPQDAYQLMWGLLKSSVMESEAACLAQLRSEAVRLGVDNIVAMDMRDLSNDFIDGYEYCRALLYQHADNILKGGTA